jgi:pimeloyl-ACP methyl ester carboxylesterase
MLCFHGYGMHGKQFTSLGASLGNKYTFWGFDLFFHKGTQLTDESLHTIKKGLQKRQLIKLVKQFCEHENIHRFSVISYSMGSHYATTVVEGMPHLINEYIVAAPSSIKPGPLIRFFGKNRAGNKLRLFTWIKFIDKKGRDILYKEIGTRNLRFALYACFTYLRFLETNEKHLINCLQQYNIRSIFIFGERDRMYLPKIGNTFFKKFPEAEKVILDADHEMIKPEFVSTLTRMLS